MSVYHDKETGRFRFDFWRRGLRYTGRGFKSAEAARRAENRKRDALERGVTQPFKTLAALIQAWLDAGARTKSRWHLYCARTELGRVFGSLYDIAPDHLTAGHVEPLLTRYAKKHKATTVNSARGKLNAVMNYGVKMGALPFNPLRAVPVQPVDSDDRVEPIPTAHLQQLVLAADVLFAAKLTFIAQTGCRWREHARLKWTEVFLNEPEPFAVLTTRKNRGGNLRTRPQPLTGPALDAVARMRGIDAVYVFPGPNGGVSKYTTDYQRLITLCDDLNIPQYGFHQLRHWAGMLATSMGKSRRAVADYLGHIGLDATERYMHRLQPELWEVAKRLEREWNDGVAGGTNGGTAAGSGRDEAS